MTIQYAILGFLSWQPLSGYDLKKFISGSAIFYWSGNNNQIYTSLIQLYKQGWVTSKVQYQENSPNKKVYSITDAGKEALKKWVLSTPELPEIRNTFLIQLAWADLLEMQDIDSLLENYEEEVSLQLAMQQEKYRRENRTPHRSEREVFLWAKIAENVLIHYENEVNWVRELRQGLKEERYAGAG
jgi:DNA-binding PadR family transcriptional regulator